MNKKNIIILLIACCLLGTIAAHVASSHPDGLEWVAEKSGFIDAAEGKEVFTAPMPDYELGSNIILPAIIGTVLVFGVTYLIMKIVSKRSPLSRG